MLVLTISRTIEISALETLNKVLQARDSEKYAFNTFNIECVEYYLIETADKRGTTPYFMRDNRDAVEKALKKKKKTPQQIADERHTARTPEQIEDIKMRWKAHEDAKEVKSQQNEHLKSVKELYPKRGNSAKLRVISESECNYTLPNGGCVITPELRLKKGNLNEQEQGIFRKELRMANRFAQNGHRIEFTSDDTGSFDVFFDGIKADLKSTSSPGNIVKYAKHATRDQGAEIVLFEFGSWGKPYIEAINKLKEIGIHGKYLKPGNSQIYSF